MKTDQLFYELFTFDPRSLFRLVQLDLDGEYIFESLAVKSTEKRFDGFCRRLDGAGPRIFLEIQGYPDPKIYWRLFREISTYYEQNDVTVPFIAIALFLDEAFDPGQPMLTSAPPSQLIRANMIDCLARLGERAGVLTVLKPFTVTRKDEVFAHIREWDAELRSLNVSDEKLHTLQELLEYLLLQRFPDLNMKEIVAMLQLTPLEKTVAGQEVFQMGLKEGIREGLEKGRKAGLKKGKQEGLKEGLKEGKQEGLKEGVNKGELIGEIRATQRFLRLPVNALEELVSRPEAELQELLRQLTAQLN